MANAVTAWILTIIGILYILAAGGWLTALTQYNGWLAGIGFLVIGVMKLTRLRK
jgi:hypothetical protein